MAAVVRSLAGCLIGTHSVVRGGVAGQEAIRSVRSIVVSCVAHGWWFQALRLGGDCGEFVRQWLRYSLRGVVPTGSPEGRCQRQCQSGRVDPTWGFDVGVASRLGVESTEWGRDGLNVFGSDTSTAGAKNEADQGTATAAVRSDWARRW